MSALPPEADIRQRSEHILLFASSGPSAIADVCCVTKPSTKRARTLRQHMRGMLDAAVRAYDADDIDGDAQLMDAPNLGAAELTRLFAFVIAASDGRIVMEDDVQQGIMDDEVAVIINETQLAELVHEHTNARSGGADHIVEGFLAYFGNDGVQPFPPWQNWP